MALLKTEAEKLSNNNLIKGVIEEIITKDAMFGLLPFVQAPGKAYVYNRENSIGSVSFADPNDTVNESAATFTEVTTNLRIIIGDVDVDKFLAKVMGDTNDQTAIQIAAKVKQMRRTYQDALVNGDNGANAKQFDGLKVLVASGQTLTAGANGAALTLDMLDELKDLVPLGVDAYVMRSGTLRAWKQLVRASGGTTPIHQQLSNFVGAEVPSHDGVPILVNDFIGGADTQGSNAATGSIYAVRFNEADGLHGLYGGDGAGFEVEPIGTVQTKDANRFRVKWYCGLALKSTKSAARLKGVTNV
jgi:hypothetical protein